MNQINLDINKSGQIINEPVVLRVGDKDQTITVNLLKDGQPYTAFTTATFYANKPSGSIVANDPANISGGTITYTVPQALVNEFGKITNAYFLIDGKTSTESFVIAVLQGVNISDDLNDYIPGMSNLNVIYDKWKAKLQTITDELAGIDAPKEVKNVIDNELKNYTDQVNELQKRITALKAQLDALEVPEIGGRNLLMGTSGTLQTYSGSGWGSGNLSSTNIGLVSGQTYTVKMWIQGYDVPTNLAIRVYDAGNSQIAYALGNVIGANSSGYSTVTWAADSKWTNNVIATLSFTSSQSATHSGQYKELKLEKGSVATDWTPAPEDVQAKIAEQIQDSAVGTNLYQDTRDFDNPSLWNGWSNWYKTGEKFNGLTVMATDHDWDGLGQTMQVKKGETYTYSAYVRYKSGTGKSNLFSAPSGLVSTNPGSITVSLNETWQRITGTFTITADGPIAPRIERSDDNKNTLLIAGIKLEKGSIATDYSLNPLEIATNDDVQTAITNALGKVDVGKTITATDDTGKTVKLKITGIS